MALLSLTGSEALRCFCQSMSKHIFVTFRLLDAAFGRVCEAVCLSFTLGVKQAELSDSLLHKVCPQWKVAADKTDESIYPGRTHVGEVLSAFM